MVYFTFIVFYYFAKFILSIFTRFYQISGKKAGLGVYYYFDQQEKKKGDRYEGSFLNDKPNGNGTFYKSNGDKYVGKFVG